MQPKYLGDDLGLERISIREQPSREGIRRERLARLQRVVLGADGALLGYVATLERDLADVEVRGHLVDSRADRRIAGATTTSNSGPQLLAEQVHSRVLGRLTSELPTSEPPSDRS
jgi:hypothetical protein